MFRRHALTLEDLAKVERLRVPLPEVKWRRATPEEAACAPTGDLDDVFRERDALKAEVERLRALQRLIEAVEIIKRINIELGPIVFGTDADTAEGLIHEFGSCKEAADGQ